MDQVNALLERTRLANFKDNDTAAVSFIGTPGFRTRPDYRSAKLSSTPIKVANRIVGADVFVCRGERLPRDTLQFSQHLQLYVDIKNRIAYFYLDTSTIADKTLDESNLQLSFWKDKTSVMLEFLFIFMVSQLVIPILAPGSPPKEFLSTLVALSQTKRASYTQLMQLQSLLWKSLGVPLAETNIERRETSGGGKRDRDRSGPHWSGPIENVPVLVFVSADSPIPNIENLDRTAVSVTLKQLQESLQHKLKLLLRSSNLIPQSEGRSGHDLVHGRILFSIPTSTQPFVHIIPEQYKGTASNGTDIKDAMQLTFEEPISLSSWLEQDEALFSFRGAGGGTQSKGNNPSPVESLVEDCADKLLRNFYSHWLRAVTARNMSYFMPNRRENSEPRRPNIILPSALQLASTMTLLKVVLIDYQLAPTDARPFVEYIQTCATNAKGVLHQVEAVLRKKISDRVQVERVYSKITCADIVQRCLEAYLQDAPAYYTRQYHLWKRANVMRFYQSLARGPCAAEYALKLESDCEKLWKQGRQSCEDISLTGKVCRLQAGHEKATGRGADEKPVLHHSSGCTYYHACTCGRTQKLREDPFDLTEANFGFYKRFSCCLSEGHHALVIENSKLGDQQVLSFTKDELPASSTVLLYLGPASSYKNSVGLNKYEGFMNNTDYLIPWNLTAIVEEGKKQMEATRAVEKPKEAERGQQANTIHATQWPKLGSNPEGTQNEKKPASKTSSSSLDVANLDAFPALGTAAKTKPTMPAPKPQLAYDIQSKKKEKRRRDGKKRDHHRLEGQIRGFIGAEYECPLGHRFMSCGNGKICKLGHKDHPKEHAAYFVHQDLPLYLACPCNFEDGRQKNTPVEITAQLQRLYVVTPDAPITISMEPRVKVKVPGTDNVIMETNLDFTSKLEFPRDGFYVLRLPYIYTDEAGRPIPVDPDPEKKLNAGAFLKDCFQVRFNENQVAS